ncbi:sodium:calcium antiporter [Candidatus Roizmanbacteria bacterium]|nr:sodium:calcium antiporter [Candidatus Roizmanbacteria bacterium]
MLLLSILGIVAFSLVLIRATDLLTDHLKELAWKTRLGEFFLTSFLIGIATSLPEISVGITSALDGIPNISLGNVIGSNVANLSIITGIATLIGGALVVKDQSYTSDFLYALFAGIAPILLLADGSLTRVDGLILISLYGYYNFALLSKRDRTLDEDGGFFTSLLHRMKQNHVGRNFKYLFLALVLIIFSADMIVKSGAYIAESLGVPIFLVGLFLVAIGTSLPELAFGFRALKRNEPELFLGNLLGSTVVNATFIVGITVLIHPIVPVVVSEYIVATFMFIATVLLFIAFFRTKKKIAVWEGSFLIILYTIFVLLEVYLQRV